MADPITAAGAGVIPVEEIDLHGRRVAFQHFGRGPVVVLLHGLAGSMGMWSSVAPELADDHTVVVPDLPGHGRSAAPAGDYSVGAHACTLRDLLDALGHHRATVVGHSLGGGIALQFVYQFPDRCDRLVLVASGGLGGEVHALLRAAALPGAGRVLAVIKSRQVVWLARRLGRRRRLRSVTAPAPVGAAVPIDMADRYVRRMFLRSLRAVVDHRGQRISATDRLHVLDRTPTLIVWGARDRMIPVSHAYRTHWAMPGSELEIFNDAGHCPHLDDPERFVETLRRFTSTPAPGADH